MKWQKIIDMVSVQFKKFGYSVIADIDISLCKKEEIKSIDGVGSSAKFKTNIGSYETVDDLNYTDVIAPISDKIKEETGAKATLLRSSLYCGLPEEELKHLAVLTNGCIRQLICRVVNVRIEGVAMQIALSKLIHNPDNIRNEKNNNHSNI